MNRTSTIFLQIIVVLIGVCSLAFLIWEPTAEGRNVHATFFQIYFNDPFLAYVYVASIPFFFALYMIFKVLASVGQNKVFSQSNVKAFHTIKYCAITIVGFAAVGEIFIISGSSDDRAGGVFMGLLITLSSIVIAAAAGIFERILQKAMGRLNGLK